MMDERVEWKILGMNIQCMTVRCVSRKQNDVNYCEMFVAFYPLEHICVTRDAADVSRFRLLKIAMISIFAKWFQTYFTVAPYFR